MHCRNRLWVAALLLLIGVVTSCGGGDDNGYSGYSGTWNIETVQTGQSGVDVRCGLNSAVSATVSAEGNATFGPVSNACGTMLRGTFSGNSLTLTGNNDAWDNNDGTMCCTGTITLTVTFSNTNLGTGSATLNRCPGQANEWCTLRVTMRR
ncbi:MAG: hypothetical protein AB1558_06230 [Thermodesulfobacteriota bacterium]